MDLLREANLTCKETIRLICEYLEGKLAPSVASEVRRHLAYCGNCRTVLDAAERILEVYFPRNFQPLPRRHSKVA